MLVPIYLKLEKLSLTLDIHDGGSIRLFFLKKILYYQVFFVIKCKGKTYSMAIPVLPPTFTDVQMEQFQVRRIPESRFHAISPVSSVFFRQAALDSVM